MSDDEALHLFIDLPLALPGLGRAPTRFAMVEPTAECLRKACKGRSDRWIVSSSPLDQLIKLGDVRLIAQYASKRIAIISIDPATRRKVGGGNQHPQRLGQTEDVDLF